LQARSDRGHPTNLGDQLLPIRPEEEAQSLEHGTGSEKSAAKVVGGVHQVIGDPAGSVGVHQLGGQALTIGPGEVLGVLDQEASAASDIFLRDPGAGNPTAGVPCDHRGLRPLAVPV
jgi:hypothetical protein